MPVLKYVAFKSLNAIDSRLFYHQFLVKWVIFFFFNFFSWTQLYSHGSRKTLVSLSGHQQKALDCWRGGLTVQWRACTGRSEEWLELWWAKKCSLVRFQKRWEGTKGKVRAGLGEGDGAWRGSRENLIHKVDDLRANGCFNRREKSCLLKKQPPLNLWLCGGAVRLIHFNQSYLWAHSARRIITTLSVLDWLRIQPIWRQGQSHRDAGAPICSHLILYLSLKVESHYLSSTIQNWGLLCPFWARHSDRHWDKDRQPWLWPTSITLPAWAVASRCTS